MFVTAKWTNGPVAKHTAIAAGGRHAHVLPNRRDQDCDVDDIRRGIGQQEGDEPMEPESRDETADRPAQPDADIDRDP